MKNTTKHNSNNDMKSFDIELTGLDFSSVSFSAQAKTEKGKAWFSKNFGFGAVGATYRKSFLGEFIAKSRLEGVTTGEA